MPVRQLPDGSFQWGTSGKVYKTRAEAENQGRAIYSAGWREKKSKKRRPDQIFMVTEAKHDTRDKLIAYANVEEAQTYWNMYQKLGYSVIPVEYDGNMIWALTKDNKLFVRLWII